MKNFTNAVVVGRKWFQRTYGNTYHSVTIYIDGVTLYEPFTYGYGSHYKQTAHTLLKKSGYNVPENYTDFLMLGNIVFDEYDVSRKGDL